jgi:hypothetical protein
MNATGWISAAALLWAIAGGTTCGATQTGLDIPDRSLAPEGLLQLAGDMHSPHMSSAERRRIDNDLDSSELSSAPHTNLMPGQKARASVTSPSAGYDAKHLNRLWGRFTGAKANRR